jgi:ketosteroid isomerase-like protein
MLHTHEQMLMTLYEAVASGDVETVMGLLTDDIEFCVYSRSPMAGSYSGKDEALRFFGKLVRAYGDTFEVQIQDILANDKHGAVLTLERGRRGRNVFKNRAVHIYDIRGGKCARMRIFNEDAWDDFWA